MTVKGLENSVDLQPFPLIGKGQTVIGPEMSNLWENTLSGTGPIIPLFTQCHPPETVGWLTVMNYELLSAGPSSLHTWRITHTQA